MHHRWTLGPVQDNQLEQVPCAVGTQDQVARWIFVDLFHKQRASQDVLDVFVSDPMPERRSEDLHHQNRTTETRTGLSLGSRQ